MDFSAATEATEGWRAAEGRRAAADANGWFAIGWFAIGLFAIGLFATRRGRMSPAEEGALAPSFFSPEGGSLFTFTVFFFQTSTVVLRLGTVHLSPRPQPNIKNTCSISPSRVVPHRSTTDTRGSLTSLFGWEAVTLPDVAARAQRRIICVYKSLLYLCTSTISVDATRVHNIQPSTVHRGVCAARLWRTNGSGLRGSLAGRRGRTRDWVEGDQSSSCRLTLPSIAARSQSAPLVVA